MISGAAAAVVAVMKFAAEITAGFGLSPDRVVLRSYLLP